MKPEHSRLPFVTQRDVAVEDGDGKRDDGWRVIGNYQHPIVDVRFTRGEQIVMHFWQ